MIDTPLQSSGCSSPSLAARQEGQLHKGTALTTKTARTKNLSMCRKEKTTTTKKGIKKQSHIGAVIGLSNGTKSSLESAVLCLTCEAKCPGQVGQTARASTACPRVLARRRSPCGGRSPDCGWPSLLRTAARRGRRGPVVPL